MPLPGVVRAPLPPDEVIGLPLATVFYDLRGTASITGGDERARLEIEKALGIRAGAAFDPQVAHIGLMRVRKLRFVREARFSVFESSRPGHLDLALSVTLGTRDAGAKASGMGTGRAGDFPTLYQDERAYVRLLLNGGIGRFSDGNPWCGDAPAFTGRSLIALDPADGRSATWYESSIEYGLGGVLQLGDPSTRTYEGFDAPLSSGLDTWVQGVNVRKVASNSNLDTHRIRLNVAPHPKVSLTLDFFWLLANDPAGNARNIAHECDLGIRWSISRNLFFLGVAGIAFPDDRLRQQAGADLDNWTTLQASLFWNF